MKAQFIFLLGVVLYLSGCGPERVENLEPSDFIPGSANAVIRLNDPEQFRSDFRNSELFQALLDRNRAGFWHRALDEALTLEPPSGSLLVFESKSEQSGDWLLIFPSAISHSDSTAADITSKEKKPTLSTPWQLPDSTDLAFAEILGVGLVASSISYLESMLDEREPPSPGLDKAFLAANPGAKANLFLPSGANHPFSGMYLFERTEANVGDKGWSVYDILTNQGSMSVQGMEILRNSSTYGNLFAKIPLLPLQKAAAVIPENADTWLSYSLQQPGLFSQNQERLFGKPNPNPLLLENVEQLSMLEVDGDLLLVLHSLNASGLQDELRSFQGKAEEFQGIPVYQLQDSDKIKNTFSPLLETGISPVFYCTLEDNFVFSDKSESLKNLISAYNRGATYENSVKFEKLLPFLASESSVLLISENPSSSLILKDSPAFNNLSSSLLKGLPQGYILTAQLNLENDFTLSSYQFRDPKNISEQKPQAVEVFTMGLEAPVSSRPQFLRNHRNGGMDIAVQDEENVLYLFSNKGERYWKKQLSGPIQGNIHQVDLFRNGRLQMAFTTNSRLVVMDRDGKEVTPFPKAFPGGNLNPLAVFDYDGNRNYRLVVTQGSRIFMYDGQGRDVKGFKFRDARSSVLTAPKHIRVGNRDYLIFKLESGDLKIVNRVGNSRVSVREKFEFSNNQVYLYRNGFVFTDKKGDLVRIDTRGRVSRTALNLNPDHGMDATTKTLALMDDNRFQVKGNRKELELGVYTHPQIFYLYDIIYVGVTDIQSQRLFLFRSDASLVDGFPLEGSGLADMADMDNDRDPEIAVQFRDSSIAVYSLRR